jgi:hypothetical protein
MSKSGKAGARERSFAFFAVEITHANLGMVREIEIEE